MDKVIETSQEKLVLLSKQRTIVRAMFVKKSCVNKRTREVKWKVTRVYEEWKLYDELQ